MIITTPIYGEFINLRCAVYDSVSATWIEILGESTQVTSARGGTVGIAGIASVDVGSFGINVLDVYDPAVVSMLKPNQPIACYVDDPTAFTTPRTDGAIFTGTIQDIATNYFFDRGNKHVNVGIYAVDAVSSHAGISVVNSTGQSGFTGSTFNGVANTKYGYQRWEDRINDLSTAFAETTVPTVAISAPITVYSI